MFSPEVLQRTAKAMFCCNSCPGRMRFARQHGMRILGELLVSQSAVWLWNLDEIFIKQVDVFHADFFLFFFFIKFIQRCSTAPARSNAANTFDCSRFSGKTNTSRYWLIQKDFYRAKVRVEEWNRMEGMKEGIKDGCLQSSVGLSYVCRWRTNNWKY